LVFIVVLSAAAMGCSINHHIAEDYGDYLAKNPSKSGIPKTEESAEYYISKQTERHSYIFSAFTVGYANDWIVEFGEILDETMLSDEIRASFKSITKTDASSTLQNLIVFHLVDYMFVDYRADIRLHISYSSYGQIVIDKLYKATGLPQTMQMWGGGAFSMRDAIHDSTKSAIDQIMTEFITDINKNQQAALN
jgi:hypothetical protein